MEKLFCPLCERKFDGVTTPCAHRGGIIMSFRIITIPYLRLIGFSFDLRFP